MTHPGDPYDPNAYGTGPPLPPGPPPPGYYPAPGYPPPGYPVPPGYPGYPGYGPARAQRPSGVVGAAVLAYVTAGLLIVAGLLLLLGASVVDSLDRLAGNHTLLTAELAIDGVINLVAGGLLIAGAVGFSGGSSTARVVLSVGSGIVIGESVYWLIRSDGGSVVWSLIFCALVIIALSLAWPARVTAWLRVAKA